MIWAIIALVIFVILFGWWGILWFALLVGFFTVVILTNKKRKKNLKKTTQNELANKYSEFEDQLKFETNKTETENKLWEKEFGKAMSDREKAKGYEKINQFDLAIKTYLENIEYCRNSEKINHINTFSHDIQRVIVLYGKTGQIELLKFFLEETISLYPTFKDVEKWKERLIKLNN